MTARSWGWLLLLSAIGALAAAEIWLSYARYQLSQEMYALMAEKHQLELEIRKLRLEAASLARPERLRQVASKLHMAPPTPMQVIRP